MPHVSRTVNVVQPACTTEIMLVARSQSWVVQTTKIGVQEAVERVGVGDFLATDLLDFRPRVGEKGDGGETPRGREARINATNVHHLICAATWSGACHIPSSAHQ